MNLYEALDLIAEKYDLNADELKAYADADSIGGWHTAPDVARWPMGSLFGVEGQILFALVRALKPLNVINLGYFRGASTAHIAAALRANGNDKARVYAVDMEPLNLDLIDEDLRPYVKPVEQDAIEFLEGRWPAKATVLFEDLQHTEEQVQAVWEIMLKKANRDSFLISHDVSHFVVGEAVQNGIKAAGIDLEDGLMLLVEPADTGLFCTAKVWITSMSDIEHVYLVGYADGNWHDVATPQAYKTYAAARARIQESIDTHHAGKQVSSSERPGYSFTAVIEDIDDNNRMIAGLWLKRVQVLERD